MNYFSGLIFVFIRFILYIFDKFSLIESTEYLSESMKNYEPLNKLIGMNMYFEHILIQNILLVIYQYQMWQHLLAVVLIQQYLI